MYTKFSIGEIARKIIRDFNWNLDVDRRIVKKGGQPDMAEGQYKLYKLFIDGILDTQETAQHIRHKFLQENHKVTEEYRRKHEIHQHELEILLYTKELSEVPEPFLAKVLERTKPLIENFTREYEKLRGY